MLKIIYTVSAEDLDSELVWLKTQKVFPSTRETWKINAVNNQYVRIFQIGAIVDESAALAIKLRRTLETCVPYRK